MPDPVCHSKACAEHACPRSIHKYGYELGAYRYMRCTTHRGCGQFETVEPLTADEPRRTIVMLDDDGNPEPTPEAVALVLAAAASELPEPVAVAPETAPVEERPALAEEVIPDGGLTVEAPVEAAPPEPEEVTGWPWEHLRTFNPDGTQRPPWPLASWNQWACLACGSRAFNARKCCNDKAMRPVRMEMHTREVTDG